MKTILKLSVDQVFAVNTLLNKIYELPFNSFGEAEKVAISIGVLLSDKFENKKRELHKKLDLLNRNKKVSFKLKYHEAWALKNILVNRISWLHNDYQKLNVQTTINKIDELK